jgi:hypothetical protein
MSLSTLTTTMFSYTWMTIELVQSGNGFLHAHGAA